MNAFIIAAPHSGSGKTTVTLGLMAALRRQGLSVAPFKVGPDFIDPGYHALVCGRPSINLDGWMCGADFVRETFHYHAASADVAVIEGVMGLFDGLGSSEAGSTAEIAKILKVPVVLVVDAKGQAASVAALVKGFAEFDPQVHICGVIFNKVASENHAGILREAVEAACPAVKVLGSLFRDDEIKIPSRHLGLVTAEDNPLPEEFISHLVEVIQEKIKVEESLSVGAAPCGRPVQENGRPRGAAPTGDPVCLAVARDEAFCFVYEDNLRLLAEAGAEIIPFSPLNDQALPANIAGIYLPGGYPELFAERLSANVQMKREIREAIELGMPVYAECGGFMYLTQGVEEAKGEHEGSPLHEFVGVFPVKVRMLSRRKALGYREAELTADSIIGPPGSVMRGHEYHYSEIEEMPPQIERVYRLRKNGEELGIEGYRYKNCLASYVHLHFASSPKLATSFIAICRKYKNET